MNKPRYLSRFVLLGLLMAALAFGTVGCERKVTGSISVRGKTKADYPDLAKISLTDAVKKAEEKYPGKAVNVALKKEDGYLVYEVKVARADKTLMEVEVDAGTGAVLCAEQKKERD
jgi:uncharacterized iron-regulated membrane protein